jgi:RNA polymerase sigma factor (sigma-70 family)
MVSISSPPRARQMSGERPDRETGSFWADVHRRLVRDREDAAAWRALEGRVRARAHAQLARRGAAVVEDVVAETCAAVAVSLARARGPESFDGFVLGCYLNARRRALLQQLRPQQSLDGVDLPAPDAADVESDLVPVLRRCLAALPMREREAVRLRYFAEGTTADVAGALGVTPTNARVILTRALARLRTTVTASAVHDDDEGSCA